MGIEELLAGRRPAVLRIAAEHGAMNLRVIGEFATGAATADSDVELLYEGDRENRTPFFPGGLQVDLESLFGRRAHLYSARALPEGLRAQALAEARSL